MIERLDGFTNEGLGNVIAGDLVAGDVVRINGKIEQRWYPTPEPAPPPAYEYPSDFEIIMARLDVLGDKINTLAAP